MSKSNDPNKPFDLFLSYENDYEIKGKKLYGVLSEKYDVKVWLDKYELKEGDDQFRKTTEAINQCPIMICCISKEYPQSSKCRNDITLAYTNDKSILALMVDNVAWQDLNSISFALTKAKRFNVYEDAAAIQSWNCELFYKMIETIEGILNRKITTFASMNRMKKSLKTTKASDNNDQPKQRKHLKYHTMLVTKTSHYTEKYADGIIQTTSIVTDEVVLSQELGKVEPVKVEKEDITTANNNSNESRIKNMELKKLRSTSLFQALYGFNRMVYIEPKKRFLATSSYNQAIIVMDDHGTYIEKRNPNKLLKQPWGICYNATTNEVLIGDNEQHCIFVFTPDLKYLRKICEKLTAGFSDLIIDNEKNELYIAYIFDSCILVIDLNRYNLKKKLSISTPSYVRIRGQKLVAVSTDFVYCLNKSTYDVEQTIKLENCDYINGVYIDDAYNIFTTAFEVNEIDNSRSKDASLIILKSSNKQLLKKINIGLQQVNDMTIVDGRLVFLSDTHMDLFEVITKQLNNKDNLIELGSQ